VPLQQEGHNNYSRSPNGLSPPDPWYAHSFGLPTENCKRAVIDTFHKGRLCRKLVESAQAATTKYSAAESPTGFTLSSDTKDDVDCDDDAEITDEDSDSEM
jgi:hypothetical protein